MPVKAEKFAKILKPASTAPRDFPKTQGIKHASREGFFVIF